MYRSRSFEAEADQFRVDEWRHDCSSIFIIIFILLSLSLFFVVDQVPLPRATVPFQIHQPPCPQVDSDPPQEKTSVSVPLESSNGGKSDGEKSSGGDKKGSGGGAKQEKGKSKKQPAVAQSRYCF